MNVIEQQVIELADYDVGVFACYIYILYLATNFHCVQYIQTWHVVKFPTKADMPHNTNWPTTTAY